MSKYSLCLAKKSICEYICRKWGENARSQRNFELVFIVRC